MRLFEGTEFDIPPRCERCQKLEADCECPPPLAPQIQPEKQSLRVAVEKRKKGKWVTVIRGLAPGNDHTELLTSLKNHCGAGGTLKDENIEVQGNHADRIQSLLRKLKYKI